MKARYIKHLAVGIAVTAVYLVAAKLGLSLASIHKSVSPVWPPTGIAIAAVLWLGYRISPAILLGAFLANLAIPGVEPATAGVIAAGNTLEAVFAAFLIHRFIGSRSPFNHTQDVLKFVLIAGMLSPMLSATIGNASLGLSGTASWDNFGTLWLTWWLGDGSGALVVAPLVLAWIEKPSERWSLRKSLEAAALLMTLSAVALFVFGGFFHTRTVNYPLGHLTIPILLWAAFRFGPRGAATAIVLLSGIATWGTTRGLGPFAEADLNESLLLLQVFVVALAITALVLAAVVTEYRRAQSEVSFLASIVESTDDAVIDRTLDGIILSWNKGAERVYGYAAEEVIGLPITILIPPDRVHDYPEMLETVRQGTAIEHYETLRVRKDGKLIDVSLTISPIKNKSGRVIGASAIARDTTERKRAQTDLRESEERLRLALDAGKMGTWDYNVQAGEVKWSRNLEAIHGLQPGTFGGTFDDYLSDVHPDDREHVIRTITDSLAHVADHHIEYRIVWLDGSVHWVEGNGRVMADADGQPVRMTGMCTDITERKQAEVERERLLESEKASRVEAVEANQLSATLLLREQAARADAEAANRAKDEFLALVSHELRTPLNAIVGWVDILLKSRHDEALTGRALNTIKRNADLQAHIVEDILDVSRIVAGKLQIEMRPLELGGIIQAAMAAVQPLADAKNIKLGQMLQQGVDPVIGDYQRLQQIVWNLLSNAIKFTPVGGSVETMLEQVGSNARITVSDTGEGIASEFLPHVFERFRQADSSRTRRHGGLGLGLAIVRHLVEQHGGTVEAYSAGEHRGAVFTVIIPCAVVEAGVPFGQRSDEAGQESDTALALAGLRILIVDDDSDSREVLAAILALRGAEARSAARASEALEIWTEWKPDVLLSDIGMPDQDGYDLIRQVRIREAGAGTHVPAIALTGYAAAEDGERALSAGYELHLAKPVDPNQLVRLIASFGGKNGKLPAV